MPSIVNISSNTNTVAGSTITVSNTPGAGTDYILAVVELNSGSGGSGNNATYAMTYGGTGNDATELVASLTIIDRDTPTVVIFGYKAPPSGTNDAVFTVTHTGAGPAGIHMTIYNLSGVGGTTAANAVDDQNSLLVGFGTSGTFDLTTTETNTLVIGGVGVQGGDITITKGGSYTLDETGITTSSSSSGLTYLAQHRDAATAGTVAFDATWQTGDGATMAAVALKGAGAAGDQASSDSISTSAGDGSVSVSGQASSASVSTSPANGTVAGGPATASSASVSTSSGLAVVLVDAQASSASASTSAATALTPSSTATSVSVSASLAVAAPPPPPPLVTLADSLLTTQKIVIMIELGFDGGDVNIWTRPFSGDFQGVTYQPIAGINGGFSIKNSLDGSAIDASVQITGNSPELLAAALTENFQGRKAKIRLANLDAAGNVSAVETILTGTIANMPLTETRDESFVAVVLESVFAGIGKTLDTRLSSADQALIDPDDTFLDFVETARVSTPQFGS